MSGKESLWRRTAGLYLSGVPDGAEDGMRNDAATVAPPDDRRSVQHDVVLLGEALDLVTLSQGYKTPALPPLLNALVRDIKTLGSLKKEIAEPVSPATTEKAESKGNGEASADTADSNVAPAAASPEPRSQEREATASAAEFEGKPENGARSVELETRVAATDQKLAALTGAVGQLVDLLQRRGPAAGTVDRRTAPRVSGQNAKIYVHDRPYDVVNWNKTGFLIRIAEADRFSRRGFDCHFVLELSDEIVEFQSRALPVRMERETLAAEFSGLDEATETKLVQVIEQLVGAAAD